MIGWLEALLASKSLAPHGFCLLWRPELIWTHVVSDALIGVAYFSIPVVLAVFLMRRRDVAFSWAIWMFVAFIVLCGVTHFFAIWTLWTPVYGLEALVKAATAAVSVVTAVTLWPLLPKAIALPSPSQLAQVNAELEARIAERDGALAALEHEISERLRAEEMLHHARKMEAVGLLTGGVAHDFNNLMTAVLGNLDRAARLSREEDGAPVRLAMASASAAAERAAALTQQLLAFARKQPLQPHAQDAGEIVRAAASLTAVTLGENIEMALEIGEDLWPVMVDRTQMENVVVNLVANARAAMPEGGQVTMKAANLTLAAPPTADLPAGDYVRLQVADTGHGMPPHVLERAFEPFFTTKPIGEGTGLGLSQVYGIVKQLGGDVVLSSRPGEGTVVDIYLPRVAPSQ